jgi:hypothetical protein
LASESSRCWDAEVNVPIQAPQQLADSFPMRFRPSVRSSQQQLPFGDAPAECGGTVQRPAIAHLDQALGPQPLEQGQQVALATLRLNFVLPQHSVANLCHPPGLLQ